MLSLSDCFVRGMKTCLQCPVLDVSEVQINVCRISPSSRTLSSELFLLGLWYQNSRQESSETLRNPLLRRNAPDGLLGWRDFSSIAHRQKDKTRVNLSDWQESCWNDVRLVSFCFLWKWLCLWVTHVSWYIALWCLCGLCKFESGLLLFVPFHISSTKPQKELCFVQNKELCIFFLKTQWVCHVYKQRLY